MNFRFLRGSYESEVLNLETDTLQAHKHNHHLYDPGHQHQYEDMWAWPHHAHNGYGKVDGDDIMTTGHYSLNNIATSGVSITVDEVENARTSTETRPINMRVVFIMKVC